MNPDPLPDSPGLAPLAEPAGQGARPGRPAATPGWALWLAWILAAAALAAVLMLWQRFSSMQEQLARQNADATSQSVEARTLARQAEAEVRAATGKLAALEGRVNDLAAYRTQIEALVQSVARARDENLAIDLESALRMAQDQAQLTGSIEPLLAALRTTERRVARSNDPLLAPVARAVARDLERLKAAQPTDTAGVLARIDQLLRQVDELPVANAVGVRHLGNATPSSAAAPPDSWWARAGQRLLDEARSLLRVSRIERPEASLLSPEQGFFVRENLKLRLQGARLALLARQHEAARADLAAASSALGIWFDPASRKVQAAATLLQQIQGAMRSAEAPRMDDTLAALGQVVAALPAR